MSAAGGAGASHVAAATERHGAVNTARRQNRVRRRFSGANAVRQPHKSMKGLKYNRLGKCGTCLKIALRVKRDRFLIAFERGKGKDAVIFCLQAFFSTCVREVHDKRRFENLTAKSLN